MLGLGVIELAIVGVLCLLFAPTIFVCWYLSDSLSRIPRAHRALDPPGLVWLLLVPCFGLVWNFVVYLKVSRSFQRHFDSTRVSQAEEDGGWGLGLAYSVAAPFMWIPKLNLIAIPVGIVLQILYILKIHSLRRMMAPHRVAP